MDDPLFPRLSVRRGLAPPAVLYEGVPDHLRAALADWAREHLGSEPEDDFTYRQNDYSSRERRLAKVVAWSHVAIYREKNTTLIDAAAEMIDDPERAWDDYTRDDPFLDVVDMHLQMCGGGSDELAGLLEGAGSAWTAGGRPLRLLRRVSDEQREQFKAAVARSDPAADLLSQAWIKTYGRHPDPTAAWGDAVKAVEVVLKPFVLPLDQVATLGKMIQALVDAPQKWAVTLLRPKKIAALDALVAMLRLIYPNPGRHDERQATQAEAEHAVGIAVTLVYLLRDGVLRLVNDASGA